MGLGNVLDPPVWRAMKSQQNKLVEKFEVAVAQRVSRLVTGQEAAVLAAVSGGADSMALVAALARTRVRSVEAVVVDHGLREESTAEAEAVRRAVEGLGVRCEVRALALERGPGVEARARAARYAALEEVRVARGLAVVATGHTASDQSETVLMRLARGAALGGAAGILARREDAVVRPLLFATREDVHAYTAALGLATVADPMNRDRQFLRVRVRLDALPALEAAAGPGVARALARFAAFAAEDDAHLAEEAAAALDAARVEGGLRWDKVEALAGPLRRRALAAFLAEAELPVDAELLEDVLAAVAARRTATLPKDKLLACEGGLLRVVPAPPRKAR